MVPSASLSSARSASRSTLSSRRIQLREEGEEEDAPPPSLDRAAAEVAAGIADALALASSSALEGLPESRRRRASAAGPGPEAAAVPAAVGSDESGTASPSNDLTSAGQAAVIASDEVDADVKLWGVPGGNTMALCHTVMYSPSGIHRALKPSPR